jgi:hypothetical protein
MLQGLKTAKNHKIILKKRDDYNTEWVRFYRNAFVVQMTKIEGLVFKSLNLLKIYGELFSEIIPHL